MWICNENICLVCRSEKVNKICELRKETRKKCNQTWSRRVTLPETSMLGGPSPALTALYCKTTVVTSPSSRQRTDQPQEKAFQTSVHQQSREVLVFQPWSKCMYLCCKVRCPPAQGRSFRPTLSVSHHDPPPNELSRYQPCALLIPK